MKLDDRYGRLTVVGKPYRIGNGYLVKTRCECGEEKLVYTHNLKSGATQSCGCLQREQTTKRQERRTAERARGTAERLEQALRREQLKRDADRIWWDATAVGNRIGTQTMEKIEKTAQQIKWVPRQEFRRKREVQKALRSSVEENNQQANPWVDEINKIDQMVDEEVERLKYIRRQILLRAIDKGREAMLRAGQASETLCARAAARSALVVLQRIDADRSGEIAQRLSRHVQAAERLVRRLLAANRRERAGRPVPVSASSSVTTE